MKSWTVSLLRRPQLLGTGSCLRQITTKSLPNEQERGRGRTAGGQGDKHITAHDLPINDEIEQILLEGAGSGHDGDVLPAYNSEDEAAEPDLRPEDVLPPFAEAFVKLDGDARTHRVRRHGNNPLPLSPFIDPVFVAIRNRWKMKKALPPTRKEMTPFQKKLHNNAYAHALATAVRESQTTNAHLPRFFLLPLDLRRAPDPPHTLMWVPSRFWAENSVNPVKNFKLTGPQSYIDLTRQVLDLLLWQPARVRDSIASPAHNRNLTSKIRKDILLRNDITSFVLDLLRQSVMKSLVWLFKHPQTGVVENCEGGAYAIGEKDNVGCVLYTIPIHGPALVSISRRCGREIREAEVYGQRVHNIQMFFHKHNFGNRNTLALERLSPMQHPAAAYPPFDYPSVPDRQGRAVPVYSLPALLGQEKTAELLKDTKFNDTNCVILKEDERSVKAQMALLRLQNFLSLELSLRQRSMFDEDGELPSSAISPKPDETGKESEKESQ